MKNIIVLLISFLSLSSFAQSWFDPSCKDIDEQFAIEEFNSSQTQNILKVIVNQAGDLEINDELKPNMSEIAFKEMVLDFVTNPNNEKYKAEKPEKVFIQLKSFNKTNDLENIKSYIQDVYLYLWDKASEKKYNSTYIDLNCKKRAKIYKAFPLRITKDKAATVKKPEIRVGVPPFEGDVKKN